MLKRAHKTPKNGHKLKGCWGDGVRRRRLHEDACQDSNNNPKPKIGIMDLVKACRNLSKPTLIAGVAFEYFYKYELENKIFIEGLSKISKRF